MDNMCSKLEVPGLMCLKNIKGSQNLKGESNDLQFTSTCQSAYQFTSG